jgi:phospholipase C
VGGINCYPLKWKTTQEIYQQAGISWSIYQDADNFDDNPLAWFAQYQDALVGTPLFDRGMVGLSLDTFYEQAANGSLPAISYIIGPTELSEHPPYAPRDGAWLQKKIVDAVTQGAEYKSSVLMISYDETGGFGDHVTPYHSPQGTAGEWLQDPFSSFGFTYAGPGFRLPFYIVSPWTRGGHVFTERADHNSQILFLEEWLAAKGFQNIMTDQMVPWRRTHMSNLVSAFDFNNPDYSLPNLPYAPPPHTNPAGIYDGSSHCEALYTVQHPPVPYGMQSTDVSALSEKGFKSVRGALTEGRYLTLEFGGYALANTGGNDFIATKATSSHDDVAQHWVVHSLADEGNTFTISSAKDGRYIGSHTSLVSHASGAEIYTITYVSSTGYALQKENGNYLTVDGSGTVQITSKATYFTLFSVT